MVEYSLRKYEAEDFYFVYEVKKAAYKKYVEQCWGKWDEVDQKERFKKSMESSSDRTYIITCNNERIGFYQGKVVDEKTYDIENICIIPEYQGQGIGTDIIKSILKAHEDKTINIQYFKQNPVGDLYKRLGFEDNGETDFHYQLIKKPNIESFEKLEELLSGMKRNNFRGNYRISDRKTTIEWNIQENISIEIILGGHGGDDLIVIHFVNPKGKKGEIYDGLSSNTNEELIQTLKEYNNSKFKFKEKKTLFGMKYVLDIDGK